MPIATTRVLHYEALPIIVQQDGTADITIQIGEDIDGQFRAIGAQGVRLDSSQVSAFLDQVPPDPTKTRREDLTAALYAYLEALGILTI
jgi:hypothetical protein